MWKEVRQNRGVVVEEMDAQVDNIALEDMAGVVMEEKERKQKFGGRGVKGCLGR